MKPPPSGMRAAWTHDGTRWEYGDNPSVRLAAPAIAVLTTLGMAIATTPMIAASVALLAGMFGYFAWPVRTTITTTPTELIIEEGRNEERFLLTELGRQSVDRPDTPLDPAVLLLDTDSTRLHLGRGQPLQHIEWFADALTEARELAARNREYSFERKTPEEIRRIRSPDASNEREH